MLIDFVPTVNGVSLAEAPAFKKAPGGASANVAVGIARLGGFAAFIGKVGEDEFGYMLADILKQNNVDNSGMRFDPHARTALAFVTLRSDGEHEFMFYRNPSADMLLRENEIDASLIKKKSGCILSYDPNLRLPLWPSAEAAREGIMSIWNQSDITKISEEEVTFLIGGDDPYDDDVVLKKFFHPNLKLLLVTEGAQGCRYYTKEFKGRVVGVKVDAVDTTGAGDAFVGGILNILTSDPNLYKVQLNTSFAFEHLLGEDLGPLSVKELQSLEKQLEGALQLARQRKKQILTEEMEDLCKKERHLGDINQQLKIKLNEEGHTLKAIQNLWGSSSAAGNSNFHLHPSHQVNHMECQPEPFLQIGYHHYAASDQGTSAPKSMAGEANFFPAGWALSTPPFKL
ncbi:putative fructokinase-7 [Fagus crenata]